MSRCLFTVKLNPFTEVTGLISINVTCSYVGPISHVLSFGCVFEGSLISIRSLFTIERLGENVLVYPVRSDDLSF